MTRVRVAVAGLLSFMAVLAVWAAQIGNLSSPAVKQKSYVVYDAEQQVIVAGKRRVLELRFQVVDGFHVNSHTPKSELLIPTKLSFEPAVGIDAGSIEYPPGISYSFSFDPAEKLDVYSGALTLKFPLMAQVGSYVLHGLLRYQACDHAACYPPKSLPVRVILVAK